MSQLFLGHWHQMQLPSTHHVKGTVETTGKNRSKEMSLFHSSQSSGQTYMQTNNCNNVLWVVCWHAAVHGVAKSWTQLSDWTMLGCII